MSWGAVGSAAIGAVGGALGGGGGTGTVHAMDSIPEHLRPLYKDLSLGVGDLQTPEYFQGDQIAGMNPWMTGALDGMGGWGAGMGGDMMSSLYGAGQQGLGAIGQGMDYMQGMQDRGPNQFQYDQDTYNQAFGNLSGGMQSAFDFGAQQMQQGFDWGTLPGLNMSGALGGQSGSSKQYQQGALGQALTNQNIQNFGTNMWQNAANLANQNAMSAGSQNLAGANAFDQGMMQGYGNYGQLGAGMMGDAYDMGIGNMGMGLQAGQLQQGFDQSLIDADMAKWNFEQQAPWTALQTQLGMLPGPGGYSPGTQGMSPWEGGLQGAMAGLGVYNAGQNQGWWGQPSGTDYLSPDVFMGQDSNVDFSKVWG